MTDYKQIDFYIRRKHVGIHSISYCKEINCIAIGRENGIVEIYDSTQNYLLLSTIVASQINAINDISFIKFNNEIKIVGLASSKLFIIDVNMLYVSNYIILPNDTCGRCISQFRDDVIAVGCDSGYICMYSYKNGLHPIKPISVTNSTILSLAWSHRYADLLIAGSFDKVYKVDVKSNEIIYHNILKESKSNEISASTFIWCAKYCNRHLCTGDSRGYIIVWDPIHLGILQQYKTHNSDILTLVSDNHHYIYASGNDPTIVKVDLKNHIIIDKRFGMESIVKGLTVTGKSIIAVGTPGIINVYYSEIGVDSANDKFFTVDYYSKYECHYHKLSRSYILFMYNDRSIDVYHLYYRQSVQSGHVPHKRQLLTIFAENKNHIETFSVSSDLKYLAYSTSNGTKILKLHFDVNTDESVCLLVSRYFVTENVSKPTGKYIKAYGKSATLKAASILKFLKCHNNLYIIVICQISSHIRDTDQICVYEIVDENEAPIFRKNFTYKEKNNFNNAHKVEVSEAGNIFAISTLDGKVFVYSLEKMSIVMKILNQDNDDKKCSPSRVTTMNFNSTNKRLIVLYSDKQICDYHIGKQMKSVWSQTFNNNIPGDWLRSNNAHQIISISPNIFFLIIGKKILAKLDMQKKIPELTTPLFNRKKRNKEIKLQNIKRELRLKHLRVSKLNAMWANQEAQGQLEGIAHIKLRITRIEKKIAELKNINISENEECCFTWFNSKDNLIGIYYLPTEKIILTFSEDRVDVQEISYSRKMFGV